MWFGRYRVGVSARNERFEGRGQMTDAEKLAAWQGAARFVRRVSEKARTWEWRETARGMSQTLGEPDALPGVVTLEWVVRFLADAAR